MLLHPELCSPLHPAERKTWPEAGYSLVLSAETDRDVLMLVPGLPLLQRKEARLSAEHIRILMHRYAHWVGPLGNWG